MNRSCRRHEVGRWEEQWSPPTTRLLDPRSQLPQELPQLCLRHLTHCVLLGRHPPSHVRGGEEVQYRLPAPLIRQEVPDLPSVFPLPRLLPYLRPQDLLLGLPLRTHLEEVLSSLIRVPAPPTLRGGPILRPIEVLPSQAVPRLDLIEAECVARPEDFPRSKPHPRCC